MPKMTDSDLCALIDGERSNGIGIDDQLSSDRARAMSYYLGEAKFELAPPETEGRSRVVSKDLMEVVEWMMPSLMRMFCGADNVIRFEPEGAGDERNADDATEYCSYLLYRKNDGFTVLHDAIKSSLISRMGVVKVYPDETWDEREEHYEGCTQLDVKALESDEDVSVVSVEEVVKAEIPVVNGEVGQPQVNEPVFNVTVSRKEKRCNITVEGVPPEEIWFSKDSRDVAKLRCIGQDTQRTVSELLSLGYPEDKVNSLPTGEDGDTYGERLVRESYDGSYTTSQDDSADESQRVVTLQEAYIRVDYDGDGISEYRRVVKCGTVVFENEVTDDHPFAVFSPILMPYKLIGLGEWDMTEDLMRIKTAITRQYLDNLYLANNPRKGVVVGKVNLDDFLNPRVGGIVRMTDPGGIVDITNQDIGASAQAAINYFDAVRDKRTGIKEFSQGLVGDELSKSNIGSQGVAQLQDQADQRLELIARVIAETGIRRIYRLLLKCATQYQDREAEIRVNGEWMRVDPRAWKTNYDMSVSIGIGTSSKQRQVANAIQLLQIQQQAGEYGLVVPQNAYNSLEDLASAMGKKDVSRYFTAPDPNQPTQGKPNPNAGEMAKVQAESQARMAEIQAKAQIEQQKQQGQIEVERMKQEFQAQQAQQETQLEAQRNEQQMRNEMQLEQYKADQAMQLAQYKAELEARTRIDIERIRAEAQIAAAQARNVGDPAFADSNIAYQRASEIENDTGL